MTRYIPIICAAFLPIALGGCLGATIFGPEPGLTDVHLTTPSGTVFDYESGKEASLITGSYKSGETEVTFRVESLEAFEGQAILLEMQRQQLAAASSLTELLNRLVQLYMSGGVPTGGPSTTPTVTP